MQDTDVLDRESQTTPEVLSSSESLSQAEDWEVFGALQYLGQPEKISTRLAIFNTTFIPVPQSQETVLMSRAVFVSKLREGEPDRNSLHVCVIDENGNRRRIRDLDLPVNDRIINWEDARMGPDSTLGLTVVLLKDGKYPPHPALIKVEFRDGNLEVVDGSIQIFDKLVGKNVIPLEGGFIYRSDDYPHQLHHVDQNGEMLKVINFEDFKDIYWIGKKMGAVARPIEMEDGYKLLLIHGVRGNDEGIMGIDGTLKKDIYSIGIAVLDKDWRVVAVDPKPFLERKDFVGNLPPSQDLDHNKEVVYLVDFQERVKDGETYLRLPVNVGDRITVFEDYPLEDLKDRARSILN